MNNSRYNWKSSIVGTTANLTHRKPIPFKGLKHYVATADVQGFEINPSELVGYLTRPSRADVLVQENDVLQAKMRGTNKAVKVDDTRNGWLFSTGFALFSPEEIGNSAEFFYHYVQFEDFLHQRDIYSVGTTQQSISDYDLSRIKIKYPSNRIIQQKIAEILSTIDTAIEKTDELIKKYKQIKTGLMHDLFTRGVTPDGKLRPTREQAPELYKESPIGWIPKEWDTIEFKSISDQITSGSRDWAQYYDLDGALFIRISNLSRENPNFRWDDIKKVNLPKLLEGTRTKVLNGDLLISITADLGMIAVVNENLGYAYINQHIALIRINNQIVSSRFVAHYLCSAEAQNRLQKFNDSGAKAGLNLPTVGSFSVVKPLREKEWEYISKSLDTIDSYLFDLKIERSKNEQLKLGLMHDLLTGKKEVKIKTGETVNG